MKKILIMLFPTLLLGCDIQSVHFDGFSATYTHSDSDFGLTMTQARTKCESVEKRVKHESTSCSVSRQCVSTFICTAK